MSGLNTADDLPDSKQELYEGALRNIVSEGPVDGVGPVENGYGFLHGLMEDYETVHVEDGVTGEEFSHDDPVEYFEFREHEDRIFSDVFYSEQEGRHPILEFEDSDNDFDRHAFYLTVHPEKRKKSGQRAVPKVSLYGVSVDEDEDAVYMGGLDADDLFDL